MQINFPKASDVLNNISSFSSQTAPRSSIKNKSDLKNGDSLK